MSDNILKFPEKEENSVDEMLSALLDNVETTPNDEICLKFLDEWCDKNSGNYLLGIPYSMCLSKFSLWLNKNNYTIVKKENLSETNKEN